MSIVALKRKTRAKYNSANRQITKVIVSDRQPGPNAKRGLLARTNGTVVNRNYRVASRTQHRALSNPQTLYDYGEPDESSGFYLNGTRRVKAAQAKDTNLMKQGTDSCCSQNTNTVQRSVLSSKGMLETRKMRFKDQNPDTECCKDIVNTHVEKYTTKSSEVVERRKLAAQSCPDDGKLIFCKSCEKKQTPGEAKCTPGCKNPPPISHDVCVASSQSDYLMKKKMGVQYQMSLKTEQRSMIERRRGSQHTNERPLNQKVTDLETIVEKMQGERQVVDKKLKQLRTQTSL